MSLSRLYVFLGCEFLKCHFFGEEHGRHFPIIFFGSPVFHLLQSCDSGEAHLFVYSELVLANHGLFVFYFSVCQQKTLLPSLWSCNQA